MKKGKFHFLLASRKDALFKKVDCVLLSDLLDYDLPPSQSIRSTMIIVEGYFVKGLQSDNWQNYRRRYLVLKSYETFNESVIQNNIDGFLGQQGYLFVSQSYLSWIFKAVPE